MTKSIYHFPEPDNETISGRIRYMFVVAASALEIMDKCYNCPHLRCAIKEMEKREVMKNENKMD